MSKDDSTFQAEKSTLPNYNWLKLPVKYLADVDFMSLSDCAVSTYIKLYMVALRADAEGVVANERRSYTVKDLAWHLHKTEVEIQSALEELRAADFIALDSDIRILRFQEEQGPGDNVKREQWRERQKAHRERLNQKALREESSNRLDSAEISSREEVEESKSRGRESQGSHGDFLVTNPDPRPSTSSSPSSNHRNYFLKRFELATGFRPEDGYLEAIRAIFESEPEEGKAIQRLKQCAELWKSLSTEYNWAYKNPDAIIELFPPGALEERAERESYVWDASNKTFMLVLKTNL